jgi:hypothetical protein
MSKKHQKHEFSRSQISAISLITLALVVCTFALGYKAGASQPTVSMGNQTSFLPNADEHASLEELIRQIETTDAIPAKDYIFHEELDTQRLPLGLTTDAQYLEQTTLHSDHNLNPPEPEITKLNVPSSGWSIQVGSFPTLDEAEEYIAELSEKNINAYYVVALIDNQNWYRVRIGGYNSKSLAEKSLSSLSTQLGGKDFLVQKAP